MGKNNRARRAAKQRREHRKRSDDRPSPHARRHGPAGATTQELIWAVAEAFHDREPLYEDLLAVLIQLGSVEPAVDEQLRLVTCGLLDRGGWLPDDLPRVVERKLGADDAARMARVACDAADRLLASGSPTSRWAASVDAVRQRAGASAGTGHGVRVGVELLSFLAHAPCLPELEPPPGRAPVRPRAAAPAESSRHLDRIRALLAKAESTTFPEEAEALTAKAQELISRHSIDAALLHREQPGASPVGRRIWLDDPYAETKAMLLAVVASANRGRAVWSANIGFSTVFAFAGDADAIELLFTSLHVQAVTAMMQLGSVRDRTGTSRTRSFRRSFLEAFAHRIGQRLREAADSSVDAVRSELGDATLLPVLRQRDDEVAAAQRAAFPEITSRASSATFHPGGWAAGTTAAELAVLGVRAPTLAAADAS